MSRIYKYRVGDRIRLARMKQLNYYTTSHRGDTGKVLRDVTIGATDISVCNDRTGDETSWKEEDTERADRSFDNLQVGDVLIDQFGGEHQVIGVAGKAIFTSLDETDDEASNLVLVSNELQRKGWTIKGAEADSLTELSVSELETRLEMAPGTLRIKRD